MSFILNSHNVLNYLIKQGLAQTETNPTIESKTAKNFNLLLSFADDRKLLIKQEPYYDGNQTSGEFQKEWRIQQFLQKFEEISFLRHLISECLYFDIDNSILVFNYLTRYRDLEDFYSKENIFPVVVAASIGTILATLHRATFNRQNYQHFFCHQHPNELRSLLGWLEDLEHIGPEIFGQVPDDGIKFYLLYQRYNSLAAAIAQLNQSFHLCCLTHNDLKLNNILLPLDWEQHPTQPLPLRLIDWERSSWGDPAFDLGSILTSYLGLWLTSLVVSKSLGIDEALRLAMIPLEQLQPSLRSLVTTYLKHFPEIQEQQPQFVQRVLQFSGLTLIQMIRSNLQHRKTFGNIGICMLQVAKTLLCRPEQAISTIFGVEETELLGSEKVSVGAF